MTKRKRQQTHVYYESNCAICFELFTHDRMTAMFCSQRCRNKARSFPQKMLDSLYRKSMLTLVSFTRMKDEVHEVVAHTETLKEDLALLKASGMTDSQIKDLMLTLENEKAKRKLQLEAERLNRDYSEVNQDDHSASLVDNEMVSFKLNKKPEITEISDDDLPTLDIGE